MSWRENYTPYNALAKSKITKDAFRICCGVKAYKRFFWATCSVFNNYPNSTT